MADALTGIRLKLQQASEAGRAVKSLANSGIIDLKDLRSTVGAAKLAPVYGPQATMAILGGRRYPTLPAIVDERGTLTYKQVDDQSWALAHGLQDLGATMGSVVGVLCRDHRGLAVAMAACGKLGARMVLMNTGFA
jgi:fatty-acyl-CoA synthase